MTYEKPEVRLLGDAAQLIQHSKEPILNADGNMTSEVGAYDTEE